MSLASVLLDWFERHGRSGLPWRTVREPYRVAISEFMLQQTQVERVIPIFERFVARWPTFGDAAGVTKASAKEIETAHARVWAAFDV